MKNSTYEKIAKLLPAVRISISLVLLTASILLFADVMGYIPNQTKSTLEARKNISEALAIQFSTLTSHRDEKKISHILDRLVKRNDDIVSAGVRDPFGKLVFKAGDHVINWNTENSGPSTTTQVIVPIFKGHEKWRIVEIAFKPIPSAMGFGILSRSTGVLIGFVTIAGFFGYLFVIRRTLRELDPSAVIPERVNAAFNTLEEGVLILDEKEQIVLANTAFAENLERTTESLMGQTASELKWNFTSTKIEEKPYPWLETLSKGESQIGVTLELEVPSGETRVFTVNCAPILDSKGKPRGVLVTFDDVTELVEKNDELHQMVDKLEVSQTKVQQQNKELHYLATKDPLTGCLNHRAFDGIFGTLFDVAKTGNSDLTCLMVDIDQFKLVNDTYDHAICDEVIKLLANILHENTRNEDAVGRYGGEEFCIVLPGLDLEAAELVAETIRLRVEEDSANNSYPGPRMTTSLGVASIRDCAKDPSELNNQADKALYVAKESGGNRVIKWDQDQIE